MARGALTAKYAVLVSEFGLKPWEIAQLTPRQIHEVYLHPRDADGVIKVPVAVEKSATDPRARLLQLLALAPVMNLPAEQVAELKRRLEALDNGDAAGAH